MKHSAAWPLTLKDKANFIVLLEMYFGHLNKHLNIFNIQEHRGQEEKNKLRVIHVYSEYWLDLIMILL